MKQELRRLIYSACFSIAVIASTLYPLYVSANTPAVEITGFGPGTPFPLPYAGTFVLNITVVHDPGTTIVVDFWLTNTTTTVFSLGSASYTSADGQYVTPHIFVPTNCYYPASGWRVFAKARGQLSVGTFSFTTNFSMEQLPPIMTFEPISAGNTLIVSSQTGSVVNKTNLTINDTIWLRAFPADAGCADASNFVLNVNLDGLSANGLLNIPAGFYSDEDFPVGTLGDGRHTVSFSILNPSDNSVASITNSFLVASPPTIQTQPSELTVNFGSSAMFSVVVSGDPFPTFQWLFNGKPIPNAVSSLYTIASAQTTNAGNYSCSIQNYAGIVVSTNAVLQVVVPVVRPTIQNFAISPNGDVQMSISGAPGSKDVVEFSMDLLNWIPVVTNYNSTGTSPISLPVAVTNQSGFYRVLLQN